MRPPHPAEFPGPVDQLTTPINVKRPSAERAEVAGTAVGEIALRGKFVAPGFWTGTEVKRQTFDQNGWFRTGDLGRRTSEELLQHLGRKDDQLKVRGQWISIAEIESALCEIPDVREAAVVARERTAHEKEIVAFISWENGALSDRHLRSILKRKLPSWSLPHQFVALSELPVLPNGKIDRRRLSMRADNQRSPGARDAILRDANDQRCLQG